MDFREYLAILRRRAWVVVLVTAVVVGAALVWSSRRAHTYTAHGEIVLGSFDNTSPDVATQVNVIASQAVHRLAAAKAPGAGSIRAVQDGTSDGVSIEAKSGNADLAARTVNAHIDGYLDFLRQRAADKYTAVAADLTPQIAALQQQIAALDTVPNSPSVSDQRTQLTNQLGTVQNQLQQLQLNAALAGRDVDVISRATTPFTPSSPTTRDIVLIALGAGLLLGVLAAFLLEFTDDTIRTREDLLRITGGQVPVMGAIPASRGDGRGIISLKAPHSPAAEAYRSLRTAVQFATVDTGGCVEVTSPRSRYGKTETLANLAVLAAQAGRRVVVVDCDLRSPRLHELFGQPNDVGFSSVVYGEPLSRALRRVPGIESLYLLPAGPTPANPAELLASDRAHEVLSSLEADDTLVLVDTPPLLLVTDAAVLARAVGGVLVVAAARMTRRKQLRQALERLRQTDARLLGTVLYRADSGETGKFGELPRRQARRAARRPVVPPRPAPVGPVALPDATAPRDADIG
jgi:non-specific protein-tyrosine kinase